MRPRQLEDLVGCEDIKRSIKVALGAAVEKNDCFPHTLLYGGPGLGKTTIANIIANERDTPFKEYLSNVFSTKEDVRNLMADLNAEGYNEYGDIEGTIRPTIVFLDEIHQLSKKVQEAFFQCMEDYKITIQKRDPVSGKQINEMYWVPRFTLIGATTKPGLLDKAFIERFKLLFTLKLYSEEEIVEILTRYCNKEKINITEEALQDIARRSRGTARKSINFLERCRDTAIYYDNDVIDKDTVEVTFEMLNIDSDGLEQIDIQLLNYLYEIYPTKIGVTRLASIINVTDNALKEIVEPYLMRMGLINATPGGRIISGKGMEYLERNNYIIKKDSGVATIRKVTNV